MELIFGIIIGLTLASIYSKWKEINAPASPTNTDDKSTGGSGDETLPKTPIK